MAVRSRWSTRTAPSSTAPRADVSPATAAVEALADRLRALGWVTDLWVAGSLATGDHVPGVSDLDLVAVVEGSVTPQRRTAIEDLHGALDAGGARGVDLGCQYVEAGRLLVTEAVHPTWTHGAMVDRIVSGITRAELVEPGDRGPRAHLHGARTSRAVDRAAADQERGHRAGGRPVVARGPAARPSPRGGREVPACAHRVDRVAGRPPHRRGRATVPHTKRARTSRDSVGTVTAMP